MWRWMALFAAFLPAAGCNRSANLGRVNLGHVAALSGPGRAADEQAARGLRLALMDKAISHFDEHSIQIRHTDTRGQIDAYESHSARLVSVSRTGAIYGGDTAAEVLRLDRSGVTVLTPLGFQPGGASGQVFCLGMSPNLQGSTLANFAVERLAFASLLPLTPGPLAALVNQRLAGSAIVVMDESLEDAEPQRRAFSDAWNKAWSDRGVTALATPKFVTFGKAANWQEIAAAVDGAQSVCLMFVGSPANLRSLLARISTTPMILFGGEDGSLPTAPLGRQVFQASAFALDSPQPAAKAFATKFREAFKTEPDVHAALAYDGACLLSSTIQKGLANGTSLAKQLREVKDFPAVTGPLSFGPEQVAVRPIRVLATDSTGHRMVWSRSPK